jgi:hypothetical protein
VCTVCGCVCVHSEPYSLRAEHATNLVFSRESGPRDHTTRENSENEPVHGGTVRHLRIFIIKLASESDHHSMISVCIVTHVVVDNHSV